MNATWHMVAWVAFMIYVLWLLLTFFAWRRLKGDQKRLNAKICLTVSIVGEVPRMIGDVFEIAGAAKIGLLLAVVGVIVAMVLQIRMLCNPSGKDTEVEGLIRLGLS